MDIFSKKGKAGGLGKGIAIGDDISEVPLPENNQAMDNQGQSDTAPNYPLSKKETAAIARSSKIEAKANAKQEKLLAKTSKSNKGRSSAEESERLSTRVLMEFYPGLTKEDAIDTAKNWALNHFENPSGCFYYIQEVPGGWGIEVQEGVGRAYLPSAIDLCMEHPGQIVVIPMVRRKMTVSFSPGSGEFDAQILREGVEPVVIENALMARRSSQMTPVMAQHINILIGGAVTFGLGAVALLSSIFLYALDSDAKVPPEWKVTDAQQLPVLQWPKLQDDGTGAYVVRLEFDGSQWAVVRQMQTSDVSILTDPNAVSGVNGAPPVPGTPPAPGAPILPPGTSGAAIDAAGNAASVLANTPPPIVPSAQ
jgi:hypothetical protein